jgi:FkbM family methyltransferase
MKSMTKSIIRLVLPDSIYSSIEKFREEQKLYTVGESRWWPIKWLMPSILWRMFTIYRPTISQGLQDYWVINKVFKRKTGGFFVDIGAADGITINNTYLLEKRHKWRGICVEPNPTYFQKLRAIRGCTCLNVCVDNKVTTANFKCEGLFGRIEEKDEATDGFTPVQSMTLQAILEQNGAPRIIDYLSIDVEGYEERVLCEFPFDKYTFLSMTIERPSDRLNDILLQNDYILAYKVYCEDGGDEFWLDNFYVHKSYPHVGRTKNIFFCQDVEKAMPYFEAPEPAEACTGR